MASIQTLDFTTVVQRMVTAMQSRSNTVLNFLVGSVLRAIAEAYGAIFLWLQAKIAYVLTITRAATSVDGDLDSFVGDFGQTRLAAVAAVGILTYGRFSTTGTAVVPVGSPGQSQDGTQNFLVRLDTTNAAYDATQNGYVMAATVASVNVPAMAVTAGSGGNVQVGQVNVIRSPIPGVNTVTNAAAFTGGLDKETDAALRIRFRLFINSLSKAIRAAIQLAVANIRQGIQQTILENYQTDGTFSPGFFYVTIDDGTGSPSDALVQAALTAVGAVRGLTIRYAVQKPTVETANVSYAITAAPGYDKPTLDGQTVVAVTNFINGLGLGVSLPYSQIIAVVYSVPGVQNVTNLLLNGGTSDITATNKNTIKAGTITAG